MSFYGCSNNKYVLSIVGALIALVFTYMYDKFERKDYSYMQYVKMAIVGYIVSLISVMMAGHIMGLEGGEFPLPFTKGDFGTSTAPIQTGGTTAPQTGGNVNGGPVNSVQQTHTPSVQPRTNIHIDTLDFRTGTPSF